MQDPVKPNRFSALKKIIAVGLCLCFVAMAAFYFLIANVFEGLCGNEQIAAVSSPDTQYKAVVFSRDCGATTGYATHVAVMHAKDSLSKDTVGNVFVVDGGGPAEPDHVRVNWAAPRNLEVTFYDGPRVFHRQEQLVLFEPAALTRGSITDTINVKFLNK